MSDKLVSNTFFDRIADLIESSRRKVASAVNLTMVYTYYEIGRMIVEEEQQGKERAEYGKSVLKILSAKLSERFGRVFSVDNLQNMSRFFQVYSVSGIYEKPSRKLASCYNIQQLDVLHLQLTLRIQHYKIK